MGLFKGFLAGMVGAALVVSAGFAAAATSKVIPVSSDTPILEDIRPPIGWVAFCQEAHADDCRVPSLAPTKLSLTSASWDLVVRVNRTVNANIEQVEDVALYGVQEKWTYPDGGRGDCEDLALLKRRMLIRDGVPRPGAAHDRRA